MILSETLYLTEDRKAAVREGDKRAAYLLGVKGQTVRDELATKLGLIRSQESVIASVDSAATQSIDVTTRDPVPHSRDPGFRFGKRGRPPKQ